MDLLSRAAAIADDVLFPAGPAPEHFDLLAREGFYGAAGVLDLPGLAAVLRALAGGCLTTAFVWLQHHSAVRAVADDPVLRERWYGPLTRGERRAGIALAGLRPGVAPLRVRAVPAGFALDGRVPWVTGWGFVDVLYVGALADDGTVHFLLVDTDGLPVTPLDLLAVPASNTVEVVFDGVRVPAERLTGTVSYVDWAREEATGSALNGFLALGVADRCGRLMGAETFDREVESVAADLLSADGPGVPAARAAASELALRAAAALMVHAGSRAALADSVASRLAREAMFLLVFASRPLIRAALLTRLAGNATRAT
ncbi:hypothetical protein Val02_31500 [Virgisporangium aliadipatigenens]|uniref:Acyl-CoA dehydrogenase n=1 Tax=Virgisporangium aliadipatigenens TaxID=741659 RepID=A0A8J3YJ45_9ACTN|nr:acyl-CoA dehydrogenase family protein [Virgisporangium aliadipatigenens]GIJ46264.1 hypothetical protein Val02_31500 [Virgisporangium aliadipatigenens]